MKFKLRIPTNPSTPTLSLRLCMCIYSYTFISSYNLQGLHIFVGCSSILSSFAVDSIITELTFDILPPFLRVYKDGRVERLIGTDTVPPSVDPKTGVESKDTVIAPKTGVSARLYIPKTTNNNPPQKLPLLVYFHGGGFCTLTTFSLVYHNYLNSLVSESNVVVVSVDYRRAPEHPLPIAYDDSLAVLQWIASHSDQKGQEVWLNDHVDFQRVFLGGDSAGGNIAHNMAIRAGVEELGWGLKLVGIVLVHPYFWGKVSIGAEAAADSEKKARDDSFWHFVCPSSGGCDDPMINPASDSRLSSLGCSRVLVCVAEKDILRDRGWFYGETLRKSGWGGNVEVMEAEGEGHVFHLFKPTCDKSVSMMKRLASFLNEVNEAEVY